MNTIGVDIGGTKIAFALVDENGNVLNEYRLPTLADQGLEAVLGQVEQGIHALGADENVPIGVGCPGYIHEGVVLLAGNMGWIDVPLQRLLSERLGRSVVVENDARAALIGEWIFGAAKNHRYVIQLSIGTGLGSSALVDGRLLLGRGGVAMEVGQILDKNDSERYEMRASGLGLVKILEELRPNYATTTLGAPDTIKTRDILNAHQAGDALASATVAQWLDNITEAVVWLATALNPELIIISGGMGLAAYDILHDAIRQALDTRTQTRVGGAIEIVKAQVDSSAVGASALTRYHQG
jgi:glucokinase